MVLSTQGVNPFATIPQLAHGGFGNVDDLGLNPFLQAILERYAESQDRTRGQHAGALELASRSLGEIGINLPLVRQAFPRPPSRLYPNSTRESEFLAFLGIPVKRPNLGEARRPRRARGLTLSTNPLTFVDECATVRTCACLDAPAVV